MSHAPGHSGGGSGAGLRLAQDHHNLLSIMGIAEYFASRAEQVPPTLSNRSTNSYEDVTSTRHPLAASPDSPIELRPCQPSQYPKARRISWFTFLPLPVCAAAYATHSHYRRHRPLGLRPRLTSLRLSELYILLGTVLSLNIDSMVMQHDMIFKDEDLLVVELGAYRMRGVLAHPNNDDFRKKIKGAVREIKAAVPWFRLRDDAYNACGFWQKVVWWHDNLWSDDPTWVATASTMFVGMKGMTRRDALIPDTDPDDWVRCMTHLANRVREEEIGGYSLYPFILFTPIAMLARWTRRPALYLPINGLQRLLIGAWIYCADWRIHRRLASLYNIRERRKAASTVKHVLQYDFKQEIAQCRMLGSIIGPYKSIF